MANIFGTIRKLLNRKEADQLSESGFLFCRHKSEVIEAIKLHWNGLSVSILNYELRMKGTGETQTASMQGFINPNFTSEVFFPILPVNIIFEDSHQPDNKVKNGSSSAYIEPYGKHDSSDMHYQLSIFVSDHGLNTFHRIVDGIKLSKMSNANFYKIIFGVVDLKEDVHIFDQIKDNHNAKLIKWSESSVPIDKLSEFAGVEYFSIDFRFDYIQLEHKLILDAPDWSRLYKSVSGNMSDYPIFNSESLSSSRTQRQKDRG